MPNLTEENTAFGVDGIDNGFPSLNMVFSPYARGLRIALSRVRDASGFSNEKASALLIGTPISRSSKPRLVLAAAASSEGGATSSSATKLLTFLGKGGSGKTTAAILAAQHYAMAGLNTCLVIHGQDTTADYLLNCKIGTSHVTCGKNLSAVRLETTKMLLEPLKLLKQADAQLNMTQGTLGGVDCWRRTWHFAWDGLYLFGTCA